MIDWTRVAELKSEIGEDGLAEVVELFIDEMQEVVARLRPGADPTALEADLHFLKGGAWNLGFDRFGDICSDGEKRAGSGRSGEVDIPALVDCYEASKVEFIRGLAAHLSSAA
ncbi:MAG: Hpt domain-containing protein [Rhodobacteraceae bacterium]|nr:Hpt domain-containing protein [Paracoccaceae bacterium]